MKFNLNLKRSLIFLFIAFGFSWGTGLVIYLTGGLERSPIIIPSLNISLAVLLLAIPYMAGPGLANLLTRLITKEGWKDLWLKPKKSGRIKYYLIAWLSPAIITLLGVIFFFIIFPENFDQTLSNLSNELNSFSSQNGETNVFQINLWLIVTIQIIQAIFLSPVLNAFSVFGEELGWRAYLFPKLMPFGIRKASIFTGVIWGVWHWPIILMGHNYGFDYPGEPWTGLIAMVWFTTILSIIFSWLTLETQSVWPAVIAHGALNGIAAVGLLFYLGEPNTLLGPAPTGLIGGLGFTVIALNLLFHPTALKNKTTPEEQT